MSINKITETRVDIPLSASGYLQLRPFAGGAVSLTDSRDLNNQLVVSAADLTQALVAIEELRGE